MFFGSCDEAAEEKCLFTALAGQFRVPLDAEGKGMPRAFDTFDQMLVVFRNDDPVFPHGGQGLVVA